MKVSQWAEIRRLVEVEKLSQRAVARRLGCCQRTVAKALRMDHPPDERRSAPRGSLLDPWKPKIDALLSRYPQLSAARVMEEIRRGPDSYQGKLTLVRIYLRQVRPRRGSDRSIDSPRSPMSSVRCQDLCSIRTKLCCRSSVLMHEFTSTEIVIRFHQSCRTPR